MDTNISIQGQGALITGASRGLGRALAEQLATKGARVALVAREAGPLHEVVDGIRARGGIAHAVVGDIGNKDAIHKIAGQAQGLVGEIGIAIHNASTLGPTPLRLLLDTECEDLAAVLETNLVGPFRLTKILAGAMALRGAGVIVHISSDAAIEPYPKLGMSVTGDGRCHFYGKPGVENLTSKDHLYTSFPYGYQAEYFATHFFNSCNQNDGKTWSTPIIVDDPAVYVSH